MNRFTELGITKGLARTVLVAVLMSAFSTATFADYDCSGRERAATEKEIDFAKRTISALAASFIAPPEGWTLLVPSGTGMVNRFCNDFQSRPLTFSASTTYTLLPTVEAVRKGRAEMSKVNEEIAVLEKLPPESQAKVDEMNGRASALRAEGRELQRAGNKEGAKAKFAENEAIGKEIAAIRSAHSKSIETQLRTLRNQYTPIQAAMSNKTFNVTLRANGKVEAPAKNVLVFGSNAKTDQSTDKVVRVVVTIDERAEGGELEQVKSFVDRNRLQAMVAGQLPSLEESNAALAAQASAIAALKAKADQQDKLARSESDAATADAKRGSSAAASPAASHGTVTTANSSAPAAAAPSATPPAAQPAKDQAASTANTANTVKQVKDAASAIKGLFGR